KKRPSSSGDSASRKKKNKSTEFMEHMQPLVVMDNISLNLGHVLGCGRTGVVVEGTFEGQSVAIKILDIVKNPNLLSEMENELIIDLALSRMDATSNKLNREMHEVKRWLGCER